MIRKNRQYILIGGYPSKDMNQHPGGQVTATRLLVEYAKIHDIKLHVIDTSQNSFPVPPLKLRLLQSKRRIQQLRKLLKMETMKGVIIFSSTGFSFYEKIVMSLLAKMHHTKSFLFIRSGHFIDLNQRHKAAYFLNKFLLKIPTYVGAQGHKWVDFYKNMDVDISKIKLIYNWIKINPDTTYSTDQQQVTFLFAGWMVEKKGVLDLFDVIQSYPDLQQYQFRFAGEGTLFSQLKKRKEENNLHNIELLGWLDTYELKDEYQNADVFILPSYAEGFPNVVLEALNYHLPVISTNVGGIPDSIIDDYNGYIFEPGDQQSLYDSIKKLAISEQKREIFSKNCKNILDKQHDFHQNCQMIFDSFDS